MKSFDKLLNPISEEQMPAEVCMETLRCLPGIGRPQPDQTDLETPNIFFCFL